MRYLILHGIQGRAGENWGQWLSNSLAREGHEVIMPSLPEPDHPDRSDWLAAINTAVGEQPADTVIVAHSLGVTSALDFLETRQARGLVSVSGFASDYGLPLNSYFLKEKTIDFPSVRNHTGIFKVIYGDNDPYVPQSKLHALADSLGVEPAIIKNGGHLNAAAGFGTFPLLLDIVRSIKP